MLQVNGISLHLPPHLQGWRINKPGGGVILDSTIHDADTLRFILGTEPTNAIAFSQQANLASGELEDGVMAVLRSLAIALAVRESARTGKQVEIRYS